LLAVYKGNWSPDGDTIIYYVMVHRGRGPNRQVRLSSHYQPIATDLTGLLYVRCFLTLPSSNNQAVNELIIALRDLRQINLCAFH